METFTDCLRRRMSGVCRWLATLLISAALAAGIVLALGWAILVTQNPVKDEIKAQAVRCAKDEFHSFMFGSPAE